MTRKQFDFWLKQLGRAWIEKKPQIMAEICAKNVRYHESPFGKPLVSSGAVVKQWQHDVSLQKEIKFNYRILVATKKFALAHWWAEYTKISNSQKVTLDGVFYVELNRQGLCTKFRQWWVIK